MRASLVVAAVLLVCAASAAPAFARGDGFGGGPPQTAFDRAQDRRESGGTPDVTDRAARARLEPPSTPQPPSGSPPSSTPSQPECTCAAIDCPRCTDAAVREGRFLSVRTRSAEVLERFGDVARVRAVFSFRLQPGREPTEAVATLTEWPVFAVTSARIERGSTRLPADRSLFDDAGKAYLRTVRGQKDPLLVTRVGPGRIDVRVFPVQSHVVTRVVLEGFAIVGRVPPTYARGYADATHLLAIRPRPAPAPASPGMFVDPAVARVLEVRERPAGAAAPAGFAPVPAGAVAAFDEVLRGTPQRWLALDPENPPAAPQAVAAVVPPPSPEAPAIPDSK